MNIKEFEDLVDVHGEDLSRWPQSLRAPAMALLEQLEDARKIVDRGKRLRALLSVAPPVRAPNGLVDSIMARVAASEEKDADILSTVPPLAPWHERVGRTLQSAVLLSCLSCGVIVGLLTVPEPESSSLPDTFTIFAGLVQ